MRNNIGNIYQLRAYLQVQKVLCFLMVVEYVKMLKTIETVTSCGLGVKILTINPFLTQ